MLFDVQLKFLTTYSVALTSHTHAHVYTCFQKLPKVNKQLAERLLEESSTGKSSTPAAANTSAQINSQNPIGDDRFAALFTNPDFEVDEASEEYQLLHPVLTHREKRRLKKKEKLMQQLEQLSVEATLEEVKICSSLSKVILKIKK